MKDIIIELIVIFALTATLIRNIIPFTKKENYRYDKFIANIIILFIYGIAYVYLMCEIWLLKK